MKPSLQGYLDDISVLPGGTVVARLSGVGSGRASVRRLEKDGPFSCSSLPVAGCVEEPIALIPQALDCGSGFDVDVPSGTADDAGKLKIQLPFRLTLVGDKPHVLLALKSEIASIELRVTAEGLSWRTAEEKSASLAVSAGTWDDLVLCIDGGRATAGIQGGEGQISIPFSLKGSLRLMVGRGFERSTEANGANACFEGPAIYVAKSNEELFCRFDFSTKFSGKQLAAAEGHAIVGTFINHPARRVIGRHRPDILGGWQDSEPAAYRAIHVHEYDLTDAAWGETVRFTIPQDIRSGIYAIDVVAEEGGQLRLPFIVRASPGKENPTLYLLPTNTYIAYANERLAFGERAEALASEVDGITLSALDKTLDAQPELGASLYDRHADGSGVTFSSRRRPILNLSPDYTAWWCTGAPRHFLADLNITSWLDHTGENYDIATDEDLHREGHELLKKYRVLVTGTHPEYATAEMMRALHAFKENGRHLYLGANGFYWVTAYDPEDTAVVECRRGFAGTRNWTSDPLEIRLAMTGEIGGLWRHRGLAPQSLTGIGFAAVGFTKASGYMRSEASKTEYATLFAGIDEDVIGDFGDILGGAAGDELDATDSDLGTPSTTVVLAYSKHGRSYLPVVEDQIEIQNDLSGENNTKVRSEITITEWPAGGRTFSAGAINWCGSLAFNGYKNPICRLATNVLRAFLI